MMEAPEGGWSEAAVEDGTDVGGHVVGRWRSKGRGAINEAVGL